MIRPEQIGIGANIISYSAMSDGEKDTKIPLMVMLTNCSKGTPIELALASYQDKHVNDNKCVCGCAVYADIHV